MRTTTIRVVRLQRVNCSFMCGSAATSGLIHITGTYCYYWDTRINRGSEKCNGWQERGTEEHGMLLWNR